MKKVITFLMLLMSMLSYSQDWNWGENPNETKGSWNFLDHCIHSEAYGEAVRPLQVLLSTCPDLNKALYMHGVKVYKNLAKMEKDPVKKKAYQDSVLVLFDKRLHYFGDSSTVYNRKCLYLWKYKSKTNDQSEISSIKKYYEKSFELNGDKSFETNYYYYFLMCSRMMSLKMIESKEYYDAYGMCMNKVTKEKSRQKMKGCYEKYLVVDCDFINNVLFKEFEADSSLEKSKNLIALMEKHKCNSDIVEALLVYNYEQLKDFSSSYDLAYFYYEIDISKSIQILLECEKMELSSEHHDDICLMLSQCYFKVGNYSKSRMYALKSTNTYYKEAHELIGDLYYNSYTKYTGYDQRLVFIAAYEEYVKSGNNKTAVVCMEQFPSMEDMFVRGKSPGDIEHVGGWINTDIHLIKR